MFAELLISGVQHMSEEYHRNLLQEHDKGLLLKPEDPGYVIAALALQAPKSISGQFVSWDAEECRGFMREK